MVLASLQERVQLENLDKFETSLRKTIMSDLSKVLAEKQKEMLKLTAPTVKKTSNLHNLGDSDSEAENLTFEKLR